MNEKFDLKRMLDEISEDTDNNSAKSRQLTQDEIKQLVANRKKQQSAANSEAKHSVE